VTIRFGPALDLLAVLEAGPEAAREAPAVPGDRRAAVDASTETMMRAIAVLLPEGYRGRFG
jgi:hypothetical protein